MTTSDSLTAVCTDDGKVVLEWPQPIELLRLAPLNARALAEVLRLRAGPLNPSRTIRVPLRLDGVRVNCGDDGVLVCVEFHEPRQSLELTPEGAFDLAAALEREAKEIG